MDSLRLIPRNGTEEILLAILRELESIHADLTPAVGVDATPQPAEAAPADAPILATEPPKPAPAAKRAAKRPVKKKT